MRLSEAHAISRNNNINLIRLIAATSVTFAHSFALLGQSPSWARFANPGHFGGVAVAVFFGLSGFLITQSFVRRKSWFQYLEARWLRIFPGLFFACSVTAVLVSQFVKHQGLTAFADIRNWRYAFGAFFFDNPYFSGVFDGLPSSGVNGSLWTLPIEFRMYIFVFVAGIVGLLKHRYLFFVLMMGLLIAGILHIELVTNEVFKVLFGIRNYENAFLALPLCFVVGMLFYLFREKIFLNSYLAIGLLLSNIIIGHSLVLDLSYVYAAFVFGFHPRFYLSKLNFETDISYGIYVLSFPIQQTFIFNRVTFEPHVFFLFVMLFIVPLALFSWHFVEKPALDLKGKRPDLGYFIRKFRLYIMRKRDPRSQGL